VTKVVSVFPPLEMGDTDSSFGRLAGNQAARPGRALPKEVYSAEDLSKIALFEKHFRATAREALNNSLFCRASASFRKRIRHQSENLAPLRVEVVF
jgi:hypothetical protein